MRRFLLDKAEEGQEAKADPERCVLCCTWLIYLQGITGDGGKAVQTFTREQAHSFLLAGFVAGEHFERVKAVGNGLCAAHAETTAALNAMALENVADTERPPS